MPVAHPEGHTEPKADFAGEKFVSMSRRVWEYGLLGKEAGQHTI